MFLTGCRGATAIRLCPTDVAFTEGSVTVRLTYRKGQRARDPLVTAYPMPEEGGRATDPDASPYALLHRWATMRPASGGFFALSAQERLSTSVVTRALDAAMAAADVVAPLRCTYSAHSVRIGTYNELLQLRFPTPWILHHMGWASERMLRVYFDSRVHVTADSQYFFGHLRAQISGAGPGPAALDLQYV
jgi:integrase